MMIEMDFDRHRMAKMNQGHSNCLMATKINFSRFEVGLVFNPH
jgi:hypothetical protein